MTKELAKTLTTALVQFIDENRPEGTMDCSSGECERLEKAFEICNLDFVEGFIEKKLSRLTEFEKGLINFYNKRKEIPSDKDGVYNKHDLEELHSVYPEGEGGREMSNIDKIRQEIERRKKENMYDDLPITIGRYYEDRDLLAFIDSLPEEPDNTDELPRFYGD